MLHTTPSSLLPLQIAFLATRLVIYNSPLLLLFVSNSSWLQGGQIQPAPACRMQPLFRRTEKGLQVPAGDTSPREGTPPHGTHSTGVPTHSKVAPSSRSPQDPRVTLCQEKGTWGAFDLQSCSPEGLNLLLCSWELLAPFQPA